MAWLPNGDLAVAVVHGTGPIALVLRGRTVVAEHPAVGRASRIAGLASGALLTVARDGSFVVGDRAGKVGFAVEELVVDAGIVYAGGRGFARFDDARATWTSIKLPGAGDVTSMIPGPSGPAGSSSARC